MALINSYSSANRVIEEDLCVTYSQTRVYGSWEYVSGTVTTTYSSMWSYVRNATKRYRYVGMTKSAADSCATAVRAIYQRDTRLSEWDPATTGTNEFHEVSGGSVPMASVVVAHVDGDMWEVSVSVSETDTRMRRVPATVATLFATENARGYDTGA